VQVVLFFLQVGMNLSKRLYIFVLQFTCTLRRTNVHHILDAQLRRTNVDRILNAQWLL
jgi:hypothetical protein